MLTKLIMNSLDLVIKQLKYFYQKFNTGSIPLAISTSDIEMSECGNTGELKKEYDHGADFLLATWVSIGADCKPY